MDAGDEVVIRAPWVLRLSAPFVVAFSAAGVVTLASEGAKVGAVLVAVWWCRMATCWVRSDGDGLRIRNTFGSRSIPWEQVEGFEVGDGHVDVIFAGRRAKVEALNRTGLGAGAYAAGRRAVSALIGARRAQGEAEAGSR